MNKATGKVVILGGGMAGLTTAWRLSEPGWNSRFESITVFQRGWRLGGKAASSRGANGRIEEHGLHVWIGFYENAFALLREAYAELDRASSDPDAPIKKWDQAFTRSNDIGVAENLGRGWSTWIARFSENEELPGEPGGDGRALSIFDFLNRALLLMNDFIDSLQDASASGLALSLSSELPRPQSHAIEAIRSGIGAALEAVAGAGGANARRAIDEALKAIRAELDCERRPDHQRTWQLLSLLMAMIRGVIVESLVTDLRGFRAMNDVDFREWTMRHGAHPDAMDYPLIRGLYDMAFAYKGGDTSQPSFSAGWMAFMCGQALVQYRGAMFWKMTAGMGDVVIAPIYQALRKRGVKFEFFHRLDSLHLDEHGQNVESITLGRQVRLDKEEQEYEPLTKVHGLPVFPSVPLKDQLAPEFRSTTRDWRELETYWSEYEDAELITLRHGVDFDHAVLAVSLGMVPVVADELIKHRREWREMVDRVETIASKGLQLWFRPDEKALGWNSPGVTISAYRPPFETWASMPQTLWAEAWPDHDRPGTVAYYCGVVNAEWPSDIERTAYAAPYEKQVRNEAVELVERNLSLYFPNASGEKGFRWELLHGADGLAGAAAIATQHVSTNVDPSDRYVLTIPGTDQYRLRPDESGYDNLVLAGDWTDMGLNSGCIEAAVMSGLEAANAVMGRHRFHRVRGFYLP